jgi:hypothetical protein
MPCAAFLGLITIMTYRDRGLEQQIETELFRAFVDASDKNPHEAMQDELRSLHNELRALREARDSDG